MDTSQVHKSYLSGSKYFNTLLEMIPVVPNFFGYWSDEQRAHTTTNAMPLKTWTVQI